MRYFPKDFDSLDSMFNDFFPKGMNLTGIMKTDIYEKDGYYNLEVEIPGYNKEDINMEIMDGYLTIKANHSVNEEERNEKGNLIRSERSFGTCSRSFYVGENIKAEDIKAKFNEGILSINLPSKEQKSIETKQTVTIE